MAVFAPILSPYDPTLTDPSHFQEGPSADHWLGTDLAGRDILSRVIYGARVSLSVGVVSVSIAVAIAIILGSLAGFYGGGVDNAIMRFTDIMMNFPDLLLIMTVVSVVGPSIFNVMAVIGLLGWTGMTRLIRGQILSIREWDFVLAARATGVPNRRIMFIHILPNTLAPVLVAATFGVAGAILTEAGLSFLGLGVLPPTSSWGNMLTAAESISALQERWWVWIPPGTMILVTVLAINFVGDGLRDALDPRMHLG
jgi:peptide/nickel transport system permease protein